VGPESTIDGDEIERRVIAVLDATGIPYGLHRIDPSFADTAASPEIFRKLPGATVVAGLSHPV
jgi:hypothetical protein